MPGNDRNNRSQLEQDRVPRYLMVTARDQVTDSICLSFGENKKLFREWI